MAAAAAHFQRAAVQGHRIGEGHGGRCSRVESAAAADGQCPGANGIGIAGVKNSAIDGGATAVSVGGAVEIPSAGAGFGQSATAGKNLVVLPVARTGQGQCLAAGNVLANKYATAVSVVCCVLFEIPSAAAFGVERGPADTDSE